VTFEGGSISTAFAIGGTTGDAARPLRVLLCNARVRRTGCWHPANSSIGDDDESMLSTHVHFARERGDLVARIARYVQAPGRDAPSPR
jgi:hypothetical protein